jgi:hypothetical protein
MTQFATYPTGAATLQRLRALEHLYEQGYQDQVVDLTVHKLLEQQVQKEEGQLAALTSELAIYEERFAMPSAHFFAKYQSGEMGDDADVFEWQVLYKMHQRLQNGFPQLPGFPHHCHVEQENQVEPALPMDLQTLLDVIVQNVS